MRRTVSNHAKQRFRERTDLCKNKEMTQLFGQARHYGKSFAEFAGEFHNFLYARRTKNMHIKVYQDLVFFYKHRKLITVYKVPEQFLPVKEQTRAWFKEHNIEDTAIRPYEQLESYEDLEEDNEYREYTEC